MQAAQPPTPKPLQAPARGLTTVSVRAAADGAAAVVANVAANPAAALQATVAPLKSGWWRVGVMWFVIGGPLAVVVASFATLALAILNPDPVYTQAPAASPAEVPAMQGRNHAAAPKR